MAACRLSNSASVADNDSALRSTPAPWVMARWSASRILSGPIAAGATACAASGRSIRRPGMPPAPSSTARIAPVASGATFPSSIASTTRAAKTMPSSNELDARRLAPCTPTHAVSPAAHSPRARRAPSRSVTTPPGQVVRRRGDRQPVRCGVEADGGQRRSDRREAFGEPLESGGVEPEVVDALLAHACAHGARDDVTRRELVDELVAVLVAEERAVAAQRFAAATGAAWPDGEAPSDGTA